MTAICAIGLGIALRWHGTNATISNSTAAAPKPAAAAKAAPVPHHSGPGAAERALNLAALRKALAGNPHADAEFQRILTFARFRDSIDAYAADRPYQTSEQKRVQAQQIVDQLRGFVDQKEILPIEAKEINGFLVQDLEPDQNLRAAETQAVRQQWDSYAQQTIGPSPALDPRHQIYEQESQQVVMDAQSISDPDQQQATIEANLKALRIQLYDAPSTSPGNASR